MKVTIQNNSKAVSVPKDPVKLTQTERFMSDLVSRQQALEAEFRSLSASMVRNKTIEVIS